MTADLSPLRLLLVTLAGWVNRHQQQVIEYLVAENRVLKEQLKGRRVRLTDDQRRRLAAKGQRLGRRVLRQGGAHVTPGTAPAGAAVAPAAYHRDVDVPSAPYSTRSSFAPDSTTSPSLTKISLTFPGLRDEPNG